MNKELVDSTEYGKEKGIYAAGISSKAATVITAV